MLAIALVMEGMDRKTAAAPCGWTAGAATGCTAAMPRGWRGLRTAGRRAAAAHSGAEGQARGAGGGGPRSEARPGGALAAQRPEAVD
jgi:hypothetical protein